MLLSSNAQQSGQSWTLTVRSDGPETVVSCPAVPEVGESRSPDRLFAVQDMRRKLDDHVHRGYQTDRRPLIIGRGELLDD